MIARAFGLRGGIILLAILLLAVFSATAPAQSTATLQGTITDPSGAVVANVTVVVRNQATGLERTTQTDGTGNYQVAALPVGTYQVEVSGAGFQKQVVNNLKLEVSQTVTQNFQLQVGGVAQEITVAGGAPVVETATVTVGQVINQKTVQEIPLNGRHFVDLGLLIPGSVAPPQNGFLTAPLRGQGSFAFNTAGNREDTVNFMINGINLNDMVQNQITFQPSINTVQEFKVDNSTYSAEYGRNSGAIVNIATRSGTNEFHGEAFEFLRNNALDARNFFDRTKPPFKRNQFGAALGGPIRRDHTFFFFSYEGLRQRQGLTINSGVLSDDERARVTDPVVRRLLDVIPRANAFDASGARFQGAATAPVNIDQWTGDVSHNLTNNDRLHGYYAFQRDLRGEPTLQFNTIPNFGDTRQSRRQIFTLNETHTFGPRLVNEARLGFNRIHITFTPNAKLNPAAFGINNGINAPIGLPQIDVAGGLLNFGGPSGFPQGRGDTSVVFSDTASYFLGRHSLRIGGEFRRFYNNNFTGDTGQFNFNSKTDFINGNADRFNITLGDRASSITTNAFGVFIQDSFKVQPNLTLELGFRYDVFTAPSERYDRFVVFDPTTVSLVRVGSGLDKPHHTNNKNFQPRVGFAWDPWGDNKTSIRGAYAILADQPITGVVTNTASNPPLATPLNVSTGGDIQVRLDNAVTIARAGGLAPISVDRGFDNAYVQSWNLNVQREVAPSLGVMVGYFGSKGTHLRLSRNLNQGPTNLPRPIPRLSATSPILPGTPLGNITEIDSPGNSNYNALWVTANKRLARGLQFNASYTWSKSIDYNSLNTLPIVVQNSFDIRRDRGLSDFDARHRFVINWLYELPLHGNLLVEGWQLTGITQWQSGNPVNIVQSSSAFTGVVNTVRPDLNGPIEIRRIRTEWFNRSVFTAPAGFGNLGRNVIIGPRFSNTDFSVIKNTKITESQRIQFRVEFFDLFNHANFGQPGRFFGSSQFGVVTNTRFPTGDSGSSRQIQFALKYIF